MIFPRVLPLFCIFFLGISGCTSDTFDGISVEELHSQISTNNAPVILDVRSDKEFKQGHIEGAIHIPLKQLTKQLSQLEDKENSQIIVYCHSGPRAVKAIKLLQQSGFQKPIELTGHYKAWKQADLPIAQ